MLSFFIGGSLDGVGEDGGGGAELLRRAVLFVRHTLVLVVVPQVLCAALSVRKLCECVLCAWHGIHAWNLVCCGDSSTEEVKNPFKHDFF